MNIQKRKKYLKYFLCFLVPLIFMTTYIYIYPQDESKQSPGPENLQQVKNLLDEGLEYLKSNSFEQAKSKFEQALKAAPEEMTEEIEALIIRTENMANKKGAFVGETIVKGEGEAKRIAELKQNIIEFEKKQKKQTYMTQGQFYYEQGKYEEALVEFNKVLAMDSKDEDALAGIEKTEIAIETAKEEADIQETALRTKQIQEYWTNAKKFYAGKKYDNAIRELKRILALDPTDEEAIGYIQLAEEMKVFEAKMDEAEKLEDMVNKGKEYLRDNEYDKAIEIWEKVLEEKEDYPGVEALIAQAEFSKTKVKLATVKEKQRTEREKRMLEMDEAFVPVVGGTREIDKNKRTTADEKSLAIEEIKKKISQTKVTLEFTDADLRSVILFLSRQSGINMMFDEAVFEFGAETEEVAGGRAVGRAVGTMGEETGYEIPVRIYNVTVSLRDMPLSDVLSLILRSRGLDYEILPNVIWISTRERLDNVPLESMETRVFDLEFGAPIRGQLRPEPMELETLTFGESESGGGGN